MGLTSLYIGQYKNLRDFSLGFDGHSFIDISFDKNRTGKFNLCKALIEIFCPMFKFIKSKWLAGAEGET